MDDLLLSFCVGTNLGAQRLEGRLNTGTTYNVDSALATTAGTRYHYVFTFADGVGNFGTGGVRISWYRNATFVTSIHVPLHLSQMEDVNNWLGRSQWSADSNANASYDECRIYDHVLSQAQISPPTTIRGPDQLGVVTAAPQPDNVWKFTETGLVREWRPGKTFTDSDQRHGDDPEGETAVSLTGGAVALPGNTTGNQPASSYRGLPRPAQWHRSRSHPSI